MFGNRSDGEPKGDIDVALELQPVADSEETFAVWMANCDKWQTQLQARTGRSVDLEWFDPDGGSAHPPQPDEAKILVYERAI